MSWTMNLIKKIFGVKEEQSGTEIDILVPPMTEEKVNLNKMSKKELEKYGRTLGIELDRRWSKPRLIAPSFSSFIMETPSLVFSSSDKV